MHRLIIIFLLPLIFPYAALGQGNNYFVADNLFTSSDSYLPKDLLKTKSAVFIKISGTETEMRDKAWKNLASEIHKYLRARGIDAVWYFYFDEVYAGPDLSRSIANALTSREIKNIIIYRKKADLDYEMYITGFSGDEYFFQKGQEALRLEASTPALINRKIAKLINAKGLQRENLLILETPEYFTRTNLIRGKRFQYYAVDLKLDNLAVPEFKCTRKQIVPVNLPVAGDFAISGNSQAADTVLLHGIFKNYPFAHQFVRYDFEESNLRNKGFQFVLLWLHETEPMIRRMLGYPAVDPGKNRKESGKEPVVYKFYIKHIYTGDVYLGTGWDADQNWQNALQKHLDHLLESVK